MLESLKMRDVGEGVEAVFMGCLKLGDRKGKHPKTCHNGSVIAVGGV
jgi:hypothetical protein